MHYVKGSKYLKITDDIDKCSYGRRLPLSEQARAALDSVCPEEGLIFGKHDYRSQIRKAADQVLVGLDKEMFTPYDFRRRALTTFAGAGSLEALMYMAGHKLPSTSATYIKAEVEAAEKMLRNIERLTPSKEA